MINSPFISLFNTHGVVFLVVIVIFYKFYIAKQPEAAYHALLSVISVMIFTVILKELFLIPRPYLVAGGTAYAGMAGFSSLPSTHTAIAFGLATSIATSDRRLGIILFFLAALIGIGRVLARVHYPLDIFVGAAVGVLTALIFNQIHISVKKVKNRKRA